MNCFKKLVIWISVLLSPATLPAGSNAPSNPWTEVELIKADSRYIYGEARGETPEEADQKALANLLSKIGLNVESSFSQEEEETHFNDEIDSKSAVKSIMKTYAQARLTNTDSREIKESENSYYNFRFMKRTELEKLFAQRKERVENYVRDAMRAEEKGRVDDALRFYNWAYVLLYSLQYPSEVKMRVDGEDRLLANWIPRQMEDILEKVKIEVASVNPDNSVDLMFTYDNAPAQGIDFVYWNGITDSPVNSSKDGMGHLVFPPAYPVQELAVTIETHYADASQSDKELESLIHHFKPLKLRGAKFVVGNEGKKLKASKEGKKEFAAQATAGKHDVMTALTKGESAEYEKILSEVLKTVANKSYKPDPEYFTGEGLDMFNRLMSYGNAKIIGTPQPGFFPLGDNVIARSVPMQFTFKNNRRTFIEDVTFTFSPEKKIESVAFGLGGAARKDIFDQGGDVWTDEMRMTIATFLENYKTAFALKNLDYIKSIFDDNAYIIVGHKLQKMERNAGDAGGFSVAPQYEFSHKDKEEYMQQLEKCFKSNEYININFSNNDVLKAASGGNLFGIQIKQDYYSEHYGDQGYLFLFVDLNNPDKPVIMIRTWQPDRNPDVTPNLPKSHHDYGIYGIYSFQ